MAKSMNQKGKILYLEKILRETSEAHPCTMQEIIGRLQEYGVSAERKSIYDDMEVLRSFGMNIRFKRGKATGYYVTGQSVSEINSRADDMEGQQLELDLPLQTEIKSSELQENQPVSLKKENQPELSWILPMTDSEDEKPLKLLCSNKRKGEIMSCLGNLAQYKEKEENSFVAVLHVEEGPQFYGWLTGFGKDVTLIKPKKAVQAYRDYLKNILKEYK